MFVFNNYSLLCPKNNELYYDFFKKKQLGKDADGLFGKRTNQISDLFNVIINLEHMFAGGFIPKET